MLEFILSIKKSWKLEKQTVHHVSTSWKEEEMSAYKRK